MSRYRLLLLILFSVSSNADTFNIEEAWRAVQERNEGLKAADQGGQPAPFRRVGALLEQIQRRHLCRPRRDPSLREGASSGIVYRRHGRPRGGDSPSVRRRALLDHGKPCPEIVGAPHHVLQLRALENGMSIRVALVESAPAGIDTRASYEAFVRRAAAGGRRVEPPRDRN